MTLRSHLRLLACTALLFGSASAYAAGPDAAADMAPAMGETHATNHAMAMKSASEMKESQMKMSDGMKGAEGMKKTSAKKGMECPACKAKGMESCACHDHSCTKGMKKPSDKKGEAGTAGACEKGCSCDAPMKPAKAAAKM